MRQLEKNIGVPSGEPLCTPGCSQRLKQLSQQFVGPGGTRGWAEYFGGLVKDSSEQGTQKKRKSSQISLDSHGEETEQLSKRPKVDMCSNEGIDAAEQSMKEELPEKWESIVPPEGPDKNMQPATDSESRYSALPQHIKVTADNLICSNLFTMKFHSFYFHSLRFMLSFPLSLELDGHSHNRSRYW